MIQWVYEQAHKARHLERIIIAADDERIFQVCKGFGAEVMMTSPLHNSGTERAAEIAKKLKSSLVISIQGDEPILRGEMIDELVEALQNARVPMATLAVKVKNLAALNDKNVVKVIFNKKGYALYFSRSPLPYQATDYFWQHIGIYGYQKGFLLKLYKMPESRLEKEENLEQLRALENGFQIKVIETKYTTLSVDTPQDIIKVENYLKKRWHG